MPDVAAFKLYGEIGLDDRAFNQVIDRADKRLRDAQGRFVSAEKAAAKYGKELDQTGKASDRTGKSAQRLTKDLHAVGQQVDQTLTKFGKLRADVSKGLKLGLVEGLGGNSGLMSALLSGNPVTGLAAGISSQIIGGVKDGIATAIKTGFDFNKIKEQALLGFEIKLGGRKEAEDFFNKISEFAKDSEQQLPQVLESTQRLMTAFNAPQALQSVQAITDAVAYQGKVGGEAQEQINSIGLAIQQILLKNKVSAEELTQQLAERQIPAWKYLANEIARTDKSFAALTDSERTSRVQEMAQKGLLDAKTAVAVIIRGMETEFGGTSKRIARETLAGIESNTSDRLSQLSGKATENVFERYKLLRQEFLTKLNSQLGDNIAGSINGTAGTLIDGMDKAMSAIKSGDLKTLGFEAFNSAAAGITEAGKSLYGAGAKVFSMAEQGWRDKADQHSPSQVLLDLGFQAGLSLVTGFLQGAQSTSKTLKPEIEKLIKENAERTGIDPDLIRSIMRQESGGRRGAVSHKGASGLMQLMPATARRFGVTNMFDPAQNVRGGTDYLKFLLDRFHGDVKLALAGYNAGEGAVDRYGGKVPPYRETQNYVRAIMADYERRQRVSSATGGGSRGLSNQLSAGSYTGDLYARRAASEGELLRSLLSERDSSKTALNALMQDAQKRLQWAEKLPQGTEGERVIRERMMYGATETIAAIQRDLDNFLNGINEQIANAQGRLQDSVMKLGTDAPTSGAADSWLQQRGLQARDFSEHGSDAQRNGLQARDLTEHAPPLNLASSGGIASVFGAAGAGLRTIKELNWTLSETPKVLEQINTLGQDAFGGLSSLIKQADGGGKSLSDRLKEVRESIPSLREQLTSFVADMPEQIGNVFGQAVREWDGTFKGFFSSVAQGFASLLQDMAAKLMQSAVTSLLSSLLGSVLGGFGGNGFKGSSYDFKGGMFGAYADGGLITGAGTSTSDSIPAMLSNGEYVINASVVDNLGRNYFDALNSGNVPQTGSGGSGAGGNIYNINNTLSFPNIRTAREAQMTETQIINQLTRKIQRNLRLGY